MDTLRVGITCYPSVGGSGVLATALGEDLAARGHDVHFIAYERPFRLPSDAPRLHFHPVAINEYELFRFPDYTLPLSVRMAEVSRDYRLDVLHVHYAVPHATAAILARAMLPPGQQPRIVTTLRCSATTPATRPPSSTRSPRRTRSPPCPSRSSAKPSACSTSTARSRSSTTSSRRARPVGRPRSSAANSASATKWSWCTRPTCVLASASTSCWRPPRACAPARPSSSSSSPASRLRRSPATCGASA